eukprot:gnl/Chilomastix_caulleri/3190.p1 GENE.gnl/Chilomastix_caulleri/3190~~gnl/Chilomastix_caulleri/3190.p1  ORF type:complete len:66 (+),score=4.27 gnl/Chilomastix_caulleri/3190:256-453(+)
MTLKYMFTPDSPLLKHSFVSLQIGPVQKTTLVIVSLSLEDPYSIPFGFLMNIFKCFSYTWSIFPS